ncbi:MAG: hydrogenase iron-sulfur subunit [Dethiobacter sp.]|nr:MAG: hydrogenase iron-sulfur subunit [Dethiobacter sp.]
MPVNPRQHSFEPLIVAFCCNWCSYAGGDLAGADRLSYPAGVRIIRVPCCSRVSPNLILRAFQRGADGVVVAGCHPGDCHYDGGNYLARRRLTLLHRFLEFLGMEASRFTVCWISASEGERFAAVMTEITQKIWSLGPNRKLRDTR